MKRLIILVTVLAAGALSIAAAGYQQPSQGLPAAALAATQIEKVKDNLYMITGADPTDRNSFSGGNTGVFITDNGVVVVDTKLAAFGGTVEFVAHENTKVTRATGTSPRSRRSTTN